MKISKEVLIKESNGDKLEDKELDELIIFYANLEESLGELGAEMHLVRKEIMWRLVKLRGYRLARNLYKLNNIKRKNKNAKYN